MLTLPLFSAGTRAVACLGFDFTPYPRPHASAAQGSIFAAGARLLVVAGARLGGVLSYSHNNCLPEKCTHNISISVFKIASVYWRSVYFSSPPPTLHMRPEVVGTHRHL
ncbi:uncharacterized protein PHACADRAFT_254200 [Phanerochaete carnosa HHB-10118-sp]|uniref:Uncharacterized protein n=1 Tax=Phanerochaete carnosa (strain HHB-10118-sp) TaxID=650164 RepID=K5X263_PHACS|nr:uncharacterized protein PHACADRAFT_254200 [Phanerochaete carnosa HHB-10118-sp]EKM56852.1 hypothetical protein PHACADRAFT_254200 [Phanerochaete carnosa HHB-10118-sp]